MADGITALPPQPFKRLREECTCTVFEAFAYTPPIAFETHFVKPPDGEGSLEKLSGQHYGNHKTVRMNHTGYWGRLSVIIAM